MAVELYMVGVIVSDMGRAVEFYRRLGIAIAQGSEEQEHVEVKMGGMTFFLSTKARTQGGIPPLEKRQAAIASFSSSIWRRVKRSTPSTRR